MECGAPPLIQITVDATKANELIKSLTAEEQKGITSSVTPEGVQLTLPPSFHWDPAVQQAAPSLYTYRFISGQKGSTIQLKYNSKKEIVEVSVL